MSQFVETNGIKLHYLDHGSKNSPTLILMHGLTANAHSFMGLVHAGLANQMRVISVDLRGRGLSDQPEPTVGYSMQDHAEDIMGLMDALGIQSAILGGHSFGGLLTIYMAANYPARVEKMVILDAGILHDKVTEQIRPSMDRLGKVLPSWEAYIEGVKNGPYYSVDGFWDADLEAYYRADVKDLPDGSVVARSAPDVIEEARQGVLAEPWADLMARATQPAVLLQAPDPFGPIGLPIMTDENAALTAQLLPNCYHKRLAGNHITLVFGKYAPGVVAAIHEFIAD